MNTPIHDFLTRYAESGMARFHMPGHKGIAAPHDITEVEGADVLYHARGIIRKSEDNASRLFGTKRTVYSAEGSSLCIRAMLRLALLWARMHGRKPLILAGRNAHKAFMYAAAMLDPQVEWLYTGQGLLCCTPSADRLAQTLDAMDALPAAVYITSPDYTGRMCDVAALAQVCHARGVLLLVDNAHGAYLRFAEGTLHPIEAGADLCCDSAHKTLPVLTGGAYLHFGDRMPDVLIDQAEDAMALFASTSPSYLIMESLDLANRELENSYPARVRKLIAHLDTLRAKLPCEGNEPMKLTLSASRMGYTGDELAELLRAAGIEPEYADQTRVVLMPSPYTSDEEMSLLQRTLCALPKPEPIAVCDPPAPRAERACAIREAMLAPRIRIPAAQAEGRILADACVGCPPAVPILTAGEIITREAIECFEYYGIGELSVIDESRH